MNKELSQFEGAQLESELMEKKLGYPVDFLIFKNGEKHFYTQRIDSELRTLGLPESDPIQDPFVLPLPTDVLATNAVEKFKSKRTEPLTDSTIAKLEMFSRGEKPSRIYQQMARRRAANSATLELGEGIKLRRLSANPTQELVMLSSQRDSNLI